MSRRRANRPELSIVREGVPTVNPVGIASAVNLPADEKEIIKEVPAKVDGVEVGTAQIYDDGSVNVVLHKDANPALIEKIGGIAGAYGFSIGDIFDAAP